MDNQLECGRQTLDLSQPQVMAVLNITEDSFSDGGRWLNPQRALERAIQMATEGAGIIDIGGESTRPGAIPVSIAEELERVIPVIEAISAAVEIPLSIDTSKAEVMTAAVAAGAGMINDVWGLRQAGALQAAAKAKVPVCIMHMQGQPENMQKQPHYENVLEEINAFFSQRISAVTAAGIETEKLLLDPGFGFGKTLEHNLSILANLDTFAHFKLPLLVGISRKSMLGEVTGADISDRMPAGIAAATIAVRQGAKIIRTHDVAATVQAMKLSYAVMAVDL
ncbi:MAG: dihydropteroate synthase [Xanthomonadales bacterium]|nr:dihydropteroate synthase [Xanthomonadales bacterium]